MASVVCYPWWPGGKGNVPLYFLTLPTVDLSSWREKIARDVAGASWGNGSAEEEEEEDGPAVLVEQQTDSAMEPTGPSRERYKDGVVTIGCVGELSGLPQWPLGVFQCEERRAEARVGCRFFTEQLLPLVLEQGRAPL